MRLIGNVILSAAAAKAAAESKDPDTARSTCEGRAFSAEKPAHRAYGA